jgi:hypothetical protein
VLHDLVLRQGSKYRELMRKTAIICVSCLLWITSSGAASKVHSISFGKWQNVKWNVGANEDRAIELKMRGMFIDGKLKEYTIGPVHDVTERLFVVQRVYRINDALPGEISSPAHWRWESGGWLAVDRSSGRATTIALPLLDPFSSHPSWYRDWVAYCGISEDGKQLYAVVAQLGRRKPLLRKHMGPTEAPDSACSEPRWERKPARVTFDLRGTDQLVFALHSRAVETLDDAEDEE